ncbi:MAG: hypothetical protein WCG45_03615 [bacterium]
MFRETTINGRCYKYSDLVNKFHNESTFEFPAENIISNELSYQHVLTDLNIRHGCYLGVGPDQNFTYISHVKPNIALLIDIRRNGFLQNIFYKALFEISKDRSEFLSNLFGKQLTGSCIFELINQIDYGINHIDVTDKIINAIMTFGLCLTESDFVSIRNIHQMFIDNGLNIFYTTHKNTNTKFCTYRSLLLETDKFGNKKNYLVSDENFQIVKILQDNNLIIPVHSDICNLHEISQFLFEIKETVSVFYTSNSEYYIWVLGKMDEFVESVKSLPISKESVIIRSYFHFVKYCKIHPKAVNNYPSVQLLCPIKCLRNDKSYYDMIVKKQVSMI